MDVQKCNYNRHPGICVGSSRMDGKGFVDHITEDYYFYMQYPEYILPKEGE